MSFTEHNVNGVIFDTAGTLSVGGVRHAFTTRHGGVSPAPFDSLNLASNRGDREENILENYRRLGAAVGFDASRAVGCRQIHSDLVRVAREEDAGKIRWDERPYDADALITNVPNLPLFAYGTDCCMITVYDPTSRSIAAIHAGWRGTVSGIVLKALVTMMSLYGADPYTMRAAIGPPSASAALRPTATWRTPSMSSWTPLWTSASSAAATSTTSTSNPSTVCGCCAADWTPRASTYTPTAPNAAPTATGRTAAWAASAAAWRRSSS